LVDLDGSKCNGIDRENRFKLTLVMQGNKLTSGILFAVLLNFKHIYMYLAVSGVSLNLVNIRLIIFSLLTSCISLDHVAYLHLGKSFLSDFYHLLMP
jgi:hypothetical protein